MCWFYGFGHAVYNFEKQLICNTIPERFQKVSVMLCEMGGGVGGQDGGGVVQIKNKQT